MMNHPNIAQVLGAGTTDLGRPYFVMELVHGVPITEYCDTHNLTTRERLDLFIDVCHAVQRVVSVRIVGGKESGFSIASAKLPIFRYSCRGLAMEGRTCPAGMSPRSLLKPNGCGRLRKRLSRKNVGECA